MTAFWFDKGKTLIAQHNWYITSSVAASPCGNDFQSHPLIENCNCVCVNLININFIRWCQNKQKCDRDDKSGRKRRIIWCQRTNKQASERALFSMFCFVLNTLNYEKSRYVLRFLVYKFTVFFSLSMAIYVVCSFCVCELQTIHSLVRSPIWHKATTTAQTTADDKNTLRK